MKLATTKRLLALLLLPVVAPALNAQATNEDSLVAATLDALHQAASEADFELYSSLFAADAVFLGTDATERWTREQFMAFTKPYFDQGRGWTYVMTERHVYVASDGATAWFDERLYNAGLGETRGSGVLTKQDNEWKISQYNLTIPVPNELASEVVGQIRGLAQSVGNEAVVVAMVEAINQRDFAALDSLVAPDVIRRSGATPDVTVTNREEFKAFLRQDLAAVPNAQQTVNAMFSDGNWVAVHATYHGNQDGPMGPFPATGRPLQVSFIGLLRVEDGMIQEILVEWDNLSALAQLGHFPPSVEGPSQVEE